MANVYYIDGYNVIHRSSVLKPLAARSFETAREALIEKVARFCSATGQKVTIVFDGRGRRAEHGNPAQHTPGLAVVYAPGHLSADAWIERTVYQSENRRAIIVVSADQGIRSLCRNLNALVVDPDTFLAEIREQDADTRATMQNMARPDTANRIEERLSGNALDALKKIRDQLNK